MGMGVFSLAEGLVRCIRISRLPVTPQPSRKERRWMLRLKRRLLEIRKGGLPPTLACDPSVRNHVARSARCPPANHHSAEGAREEEGMQKTLLRGRGQSVSLSRLGAPQPFVPSHPACDRRDMRARRCITADATEASHRRGRRMQTNTRYWPRDLDARDVLPTRQPSVQSVLSTVT
jgi:hypothetical protein